MKAHLILIYLAASAFWVGCHPKQQTETPVAAKVEGDTILLPENSPQKGSLTVEAATERKAVNAHLTGRLVWNDDATVRVFSPVAGRVTGIAAVLGQVVSTNDVLARIVSPDFGQAQADVRKATADLLLAERNLARLRELYDHGATARKEVEAAEDAQAGAQAEKERATGRLAIYGGSTETADPLFALKAPLAGVVVEKNVNPGQEVRPDQMLANAPTLFAPLFVISDPAQLWLWLDVTEMDMAAFKPGLALRIRTRAYPDRVFEGRVESVGDALDSATRTVKVRGLVANRERLLKAEMYVTVEVALEPTASMASAVDVPTKAVFLKDNRHYLFIEKAPGQYERRPVRLGTESDGKILILQGVGAGQRVVTEGCLLLQALMEEGAKS